MSKFAIGASSQQALWDASALVTDWHLDRVLGDDANDGSAAHPLKTGAELSRRLGPWARWSQSVTITVGVNGLADALTVKGDTVLAGVHVDIVGTPTQLADAGTVTAYTVMDHATPRGPTIKCTGIADWTPYVGKRLRVTSGANEGAILWVVKASPNGLGLDVARCTLAYCKNDIALSAPTFRSVVLAVGNPVVIESLPYVPAVTQLLGGAYTAPGGNGWPSRQAAIVDIDCNALTVERTGDLSSYRTVTFGCAMSIVDTKNANYLLGFTRCDYVACNVIVRVGIAACVFLGSILGSCFTREVGTTTGLLPTAPGSQIHVQDCVFQSVSCSGRGGFHTLSNVQFFDLLTAAGASCQLSQIACTFTNVSTEGCTNRGIYIYNNSVVSANGTVNIQGTVSHVYLVTTPALALPLTVTLANLIPCNDFAWSGKTVLVAGTAAVVVPYVDWTKQRITISRTVKGGTIGTVEVPEASRTSTGFTLLSDNVLDTSTIEWSFSPLGRNIMVTA